MANPLTEVEFKAGEKVYTFKLGTHAQMMIERQSKMTAAKFFRREEDEWGVGDLVLVFCAGLNRKHNLTEEQTADLIDEIGQTKAQEVLLEALQLAQAKTTEGGEQSSPPIAKAAPIGTDS